MTTTRKPNQTQLGNGQTDHGIRKGSSHEQEMMDFQLGSSHNQFRVCTISKCMDISKPIPKGSTKSQEILLERKNAASLAKALYTANGLPMALGCFLYSFLHGSNPRDRERPRIDALMESEIQHLEDRIVANRGTSKVRLSDSEELHVKDYDDQGIELDGDESNWHPGSTPPPD